MSKEQKVREQNVLWRALKLNIQLKWRRSKPQTIFMLSMSMIPGLLSALSIPALEFFLRGIEQAAQGAGFQAVIWGAAVLCGVNVISHAMNEVQDYFQSVYAKRLQTDLTAMVMRAFSRKEPICFEDPKVLESAEKAYSGIDNFRIVEYSIVSEGMYTAAYLGVMLVYLALRSPVLAVVLLLSMVPMVVVQKKIQTINDMFEEKRAAMKREFDYCEACVAGKENYKETRLLGAFSYFFDRYTQHIGAFCKFRRRHILHEKVLDASASVLSLVGFAVMLVVMVMELASGRLEATAFAALFSSLVLVYVEAMLFFGNVFWVIAQKLPAVANMFKALDLPERQGEAREANGVPGVTLTDVRFRYPGAEKEAVCGVSLRIQPGETIAIVGENGAGKTTLVRLLTGLYLPDEGCVEIGGQDTRRMDLPSAVKSVSAVFQKYMRYPLLLKENVRISQAERRDEVAGVLRKAGLPEDSECFPQGEDTMLSREFDGVDLSGGQWQRVAIARGLYRAHGLIVLDEPTAAIDPLEETRVYRMFAELARDRTAVIVTHRMGSARIADRIVVMDGGVIAEMGTHEQLMQKAGLYAHMVDAQAEWYEMDGGEPSCEASCCTV